MTATVISFPNTRLTSTTPYEGWQLTLFSSHFAVRSGRTITAHTAEEMIDSYVQPQWLDHVCEGAKQVKDSSPCITPALMAEGQPRSHAAAGLARVLFVDFDGPGGAGLTLAAADELYDTVRRLDKLAVIHTTSSTPFLAAGMVKLRLVMPLMDAVEPEGYTRLWTFVSDYIRRDTGIEADSTKTHPGDLLYRPVFARSHEDRWQTWLHASDSLLWEMPLAEVTGAALAESPYDRLRLSTNKNDALFRVSYGLGRKAARDGDDCETEADNVWPELERGLVDNAVSEPVKDWPAARATFDRKFRAGYRDEQREQTTLIDAYTLRLRAELRESGGTQQLAELGTVTGRSCKPLCGVLQRMGSLVAAGLGMPADELAALGNRVAAAVAVNHNETARKKLIGAWESGLAAPVDVARVCREEQEKARTHQSWRDLDLVLDEKGHWPEVNATNVVRLFANDPELQGLFRRNGRSELDEVVVQREFRGLTAGAVVDLRDSRAGYLRFATYCAEQRQMPFLRVEEYDRGIERVIGELPVMDPVAAYLDGLEQTAGCGVEALETFFVRHGAAADNAVVRAMTRAFFLSAVRTVYEPGCKTNLMWVLIGPQGVGKTQLLHNLVCDERYFGTIESDEIAGGLTSDGGRKPRQTAATSWLIEVPEIVLAGKAVAMWKSFISDFMPSVRKPYSRVPVVLPRRGLLVATSNIPQIFKDSSGNRRFLPITLGQRIDLAAVRAERDSLWAEAVRLYRLAPDSSGVPEELWEQLADEQESHRAVSSVEEQLHGLTNGRIGWPLADQGRPGSYVSSTGLRAEWLAVPATDGQSGDKPKLLSFYQLTSILQSQNAAAVVAALTKLGWEFRRSRDFFTDGKQTRMWIHPDWK